MGIHASRITLHDGGKRFDTVFADPYVVAITFMAEPTPNPPDPNQPVPPPGAAPAKSPESAKVQPKKETVRIALPPKPTAAPTIKLPSLPPTSAAPAGAAPATAAPGARPATAAAP